MVRSSRNASVRAAKAPRSVSNGAFLIPLSNPTLASTGALLTSSTCSRVLTERSRTSRATARPMPSTNPISPATTRLSRVRGVTGSAWWSAGSVTRAMICELVVPVGVSTSAR